MHYPKVYIVILNWNRHVDTLECIESVKKINYPNYNIILVDNGSTDISPDIFKQRHEDIILIKNEENIGYADGNNVGIRNALLNKAEYVWLLNNDAVVHPDALTEMVDIGEKVPESGILGSKIYYYDRPEVIWFAGATINWKYAFSYHIGCDQNDKPLYDIIKEVDRVTGCSMLVKRDVCEKIGLMDEKLFLYAEELDWCVRAKIAGYKILYIPGSKVYHKVSVSTGGNNSIVFNYFNTRNFLYVIKKNFLFPRREYYLFYSVYARLMECKGMYNKIFKYMFNNTDDIPVEYYKFIGVCDFIAGKMGKGRFKDIL